LEEFDMTRDKGPAYLLKVGNGGQHPAFATVAGLRAISMSVDGKPVDLADWHKSPPAFDGKPVSVAGSGIFTGSAAETRLKSNALSGLLDDYEICLETGQRIRGRFLVTRLDYSGDWNGERNYSLSLESYGPVSAPEPSHG
jgi:predicted secreted protein